MQNIKTCVERKHSGSQNTFILRFLHTYRITHISVYIMKNLKAFTLAPFYLINIPIRNREIQIQTKKNKAMSLFVCIYTISKI